MKVLAELTQEALGLPAAERLQLARLLLDTSEFDGVPAPDVEILWADEIQARLAAVKSGTARSRPAADVFADLDRRFPG
jgi:hypothetical protein